MQREYLGQGDEEVSENMGKWKVELPGLRFGSYRMRDGVEGRGKGKLKLDN